MTKPKFSILTTLVAATFVACVTITACGHRGEIAGVIDTTDFMIPSGEALTVTRDVTINASRKIEIDGTLYVAPGANVTFNSPSVNVPGAVQNLATRVGWWSRVSFGIRRIRGQLANGIDRMLGRQPTYWARGPLDCFSPQGRITSGASAPREVAQSSP